MKHIYLFLVALVLSTSIFSQTEFWGTINSGGTNGRGLIFKSDGNGENLEVKYNFPDLNYDSKPYYPSKKMLLASNGNFYGIHGYSTQSCYGCGGGGIYEFNPKTLTVVNKALHGCNDMVLGKDDIIYGVGSPWGAVISCLFKYDIKNNTLNKIVDFNFAIGRHPQNIILGSDGKIYGMTTEGGINQKGVLFQYDPATNIFAVIHDFTNVVSGNLVEGSDHTIYTMYLNDYDFNQRMEVFKYNINNKEFSYNTIP
ncbi:MAG: hypothetical protein IPO21_15425, partial [Bacteroidales bacterium]|nr:hypothetical protein [Bacteroidales bacterium]